MNVHIYFLRMTDEEDTLTYIMRILILKEYNYLL